MVEEVITALTEGEGADLVNTFLEVNGLNPSSPQTLAELIPWLVSVVVAVALVSGVFAVIGKLTEIFTNFRRW